MNTRHFRHLATILLAAATLTIATGCTEDDELTTISTGTTGSSSGTTPTTGSTTLTYDALSFTVAFDASDTSYGTAAETVPTAETDEAYEDYVENFTAEHTVAIVYDGNTVSVSGATDGIDIATDGADVVVTSNVKGVNYVLSGASGEGSFKMADGADDKKFQLTLAGLTLTKAAGAVINIQPSKRCYLTLAEGTTNSLTSNGSYEGSDEKQKGCIFSEGKLLIGGAGSLSVASTALHGICSDDYVWIHSGPVLAITASAKDGIHANDSVVVSGGTTSIVAFGDGIQAEETTARIVQTGGYLHVEAASSGTDRSHGLKCDGDIVLAGGALQVEVSDAGAKAVKADGTVSISGGRQTLITSGAAVIDDGDTDYTSSACIKADAGVVISGGELWAMSSGAGGKGISSDATVSISGGTTRILTTGAHVGSSSDGGMRGWTRASSSASSSPKGIKADGNITISDGTVLVRTTGGDGAEGIESKATITVNGGTTGVKATDDAVNASSAIVMNGGILYGHGTDNDGIDSNGTITVAGGVMIGSGTSSPEEGIDIDNGTIAASGGVVIGIGGNMNGTPPVTSGQSYVTASNLSWSGGTYLNLATSDGASLLSLQLDRSMSQGSVMISTPAISSGTAYTISVGGALDGATSEVFGYATDGTYSGGSSTSVTAGTSSGSGGQGQGGFPGGGGRR